MSNSVKILIEKIEEYKSKYYKNQLIKGFLISLALLITAFLFVNFIEYFGRLNSSLRALLLFIFISVLLYTLVYLIGKPLLYFFRLRKGFSDQEAARDIGNFFPEIGDKLVNTLQLSSEKIDENSLLLASIEQKSSDLKFYQFKDAINLKENKQYLKYAIPPLLMVLLISAVSPSFFKSSERIIKFRQEFVEEAPFKFHLLNKKLDAYRNEDFTLNLDIKGSALPEEVFLVYNDRRFKMTPSENGKGYSYTFNKLQQNIDFRFEASGFYSKGYSLSLLNRPELLSFDIIASYPAYLGKTPEKLENVGNLVVPEGTNIQWIFNTQYADSLTLVFNESGRIATEQKHTNEYRLSRKMIQSSDYQIVMKNNLATNDEKISYYINVIPDQFPKIQLEQIRDSVLYNYIALGGNISDDYGISDFQLKYRIKNRKEKGYETARIGFSKNQISQSFFHQFDIASLNLTEGDELEYYLELWDNDGINGPKSAKTGTMIFALPSSREFDQEVEKQIENTESKMEELLQKSKELKKSLDEIDKNLKTKKEVDFQDKKKMEELLKKREEMLKDLQALQRQFDQMQEKQNRFQQQSPETQQKMEQLQKLLSELMQNEENQLFKQLEELLEKNEPDKLLEQLQKMKEKERNLDRNIDRTKAL
jgi:hypothetical protein